MGERFSDWQKPVCWHGVPTQWHWVVYHPDKFVIGKNVDIGAHTDIFCHYGVTIEDDVQIGAGCRIYSYNSEDGTKGKILIKKGACIGANSVIFPGVTIGKKAKVGALSLVKSDIPNNAVAVGIPAKVKGGDYEHKGQSCLDCRGVGFDRGGACPVTVRFAGKCLCS